MARYVWTLDHHWPDGPDGGEDLGIFTSKRKAIQAAREHAGLPKGSRRLKWESAGTGQSSTLLVAEMIEEAEEDDSLYSSPRTIESTYYVQRRLVR